MLSFVASNHTIMGIPGYFFFAEIGLVVSICAFFALITAKDYSLPLNVKIIGLSLIGLLVSARIAGGLSGIYRDIGNGSGVSLESFSKAGIVFYGGLIGFLISYRFLSQKHKQDLHVLDIVAVIIPLFHAIARVGCFFGGCCYGVENHGILAILYTNTVRGEVESVQRLPIQLFESAFNFLLFIYLLTLVLKPDWESKRILTRYLLIYSIGRFVLEFFRGDSVRGILFGVSFSQTISIIIWIILFLHVYRNKRHNVTEEITL